MADKVQFGRMQTGRVWSGWASRQAQAALDVSLGDRLSKLTDARPDEEFGSVGDSKRYVPPISNPV